METELAFFSSPRQGRQCRYGAERQSWLTRSAMSRRFAKRIARAESVATTARETAGARITEALPESG